MKYNNKTMWFTEGVYVEESAEQQLSNIAGLDFVKRIAVMPDVHLGKGATVGSVIATEKAIIPAAVGVDIGCGMMAIQTPVRADQLPDNLVGFRSAIERAVPHGRSHNGDRKNDVGAWSTHKIPGTACDAWFKLEHEFKVICNKYPKIETATSVAHLGTLGTGNHFIELCLDENDMVWIMLHSGSRGVGNRIGQTFINLAKREMERWYIHLPDKDLAYLPEGTTYYADYIQAVNWAQQFARLNREVMMAELREALVHVSGLPFDITVNEAINCHHNYVTIENHMNRNVHVTRKGAVRAREGDLGIIPGSMGAKSFIVRGKGNPQSLCSCSHGAGRMMSRTAAKKRFTHEDLVAQTAGVECRKDDDVIDEIPGAYKDIDAVMAAQSELVDVVATLKQVVCVKG